MDHRVVEDYLDEYLRGLLTPEELEQFETHRRDCADCTELLVEAKQQFALEQRIATEMHIPQASLKVKITEALASTPRAARTRRSWLLPSGGLIGLATIACAVLLFRADSPPSTPSAVPASAPVAVPASVPASAPALSADLAPIPPVNTPQAQIPAGYRAMSIEVDAQSGVEGWAQPGTRVDVLLSYKDKTNGKKVAAVSNSATVLSFAPSDSSSLNAEQSKGEIKRMITIQTTELDAKKIELAKTIGTLSLALVGEVRPDKQTVPPESVEESSLFPAGDKNGFPSDTRGPKGVMMAPDPQTGEMIKYELYGDVWRKAPVSSSGSSSSTESSETARP